MTSALLASWVSSYPWRRRLPTTSSLSRTFIWQPTVSMKSFWGMGFLFYTLISAGFGSTLIPRLGGATQARPIAAVGGATGNSVCLCFQGEIEAVPQNRFHHLLILLVFDAA